MSTKIHAVITGDIVGSRQMKNEDRINLLNVLQSTFQDVTKYVTPVSFEIFRGDSFQGVIERPEEALLVSLIIRCSLRRYSWSGSLDDHWDARVSIGLGDIDAPMEKIVESDGEAFQLSGETLDVIKKTDQRISIATGNASNNAEFAVECALADTIIKRWTTNQAEAIYSYLLENKTQEQLARQFNISQPAIRKRLIISGNIDAVQLFIHRFRQIIKNSN